MKDFYDVLDEQEKNLGMAMKAFEDQELKKHTLCLSLRQSGPLSRLKTRSIRRIFLSWQACMIILESPQTIP